MPRPRLFLIDSYGYIFRAYHARARSAAPPMRTNAGVPTEAVYIFHNMLRKLMETHHPDYLGAVFESGKTFRDEAFAAYKANRAEMPAELAQQIPYIRRMLEVMRIPILEFPGFEADDVIGALARRASEKFDVVIVSSDKDLLQLVDDHILMLNPAKDDTLYDAARTEEFLGVKPSQVADLLALKGDAVDNIPGAPGIGDKGAKDLIVQFGSVEAALEHADEVKKKTYRDSLLAHRDQILLSKHLATVDTSVPIEADLENLRVQAPDWAALRSLYQELEFHSLLKQTAANAPVEAGDYAELGTVAEIEAYLESIPADRAAGFALARGEDGALVAPMAAVAAQAGHAREFAIELLPAAGPFLADVRRPKAVYDFKSTLLALESTGVALQGVAHDLMLYEFLLTSDPGGCSLSFISDKYKHCPPAPGAAASASLACELGPLLAAEVSEAGLKRVYDEIDLPLAPVLARMESNGISIAPEALAEMSKRLELEIERLTQAIHTLAGKPFNINSPQQLAKVLFEDLQLPVPARGRSKQPSTDASVLEGLSSDYEIARLVLEYRQLTKLKGTYIDALPQLVRPSTGRIHTTFHQTGAATGRLSSSDPNLQNIPIRTDLGREIRAAFVPAKGWKLLAADYSQIELRLLAHVSGDALLTEAFRNGEDIHARTAAEVFGVMPALVTPEMRRAAKAVNFGIVYGQTPFGLAQSLGISRQEAERYIHTYFARHDGVRRYIDAAIEEARTTGYARTMFGRRRPIPGLDSPNPSARSFAERTAVNTPLQGAAADLIKLAMIRIDRALQERKLRSRMLLQVHDELVFEAPPEEVESLAAMVKQEMEHAHEFAVPLVVEVGIGENWRDAK
jgi:DNA polymerase-1